MDRLAQAPRQQFSKETSRQFFFFLINGGLIGLVAWAAQLGLFHLLGGATGMKYALAASIVYVPLVLVNFTIQKRLIFSKPGSFVRFILANVVAMLVVSALSPAARWGLTLLAGAAWGNYLGFPVASLLVAPLSFLMTRFWAFA